MAILSLAVLMIMLGISVARDCGDVPHTDGCSAWNIVPYKSKFRSSCDKHDVCYSCGRSFGITRSQCDKKFKQDMYRACGNSWSWWCKRWAYIYYKAVDIRGNKYYKKSKQAWCKSQPWYKTECMP